MASNCCKVNIAEGENCCCRCGGKGCYSKQVYGVCRLELPCVRLPKPRPPNFVSNSLNSYFFLMNFQLIKSVLVFLKYNIFKNHRNPDLPWIDWHFRPLITSDSTNRNNYHYHLKRRTPCVGDIYYHDLPEDQHKFIWKLSSTSIGTNY